MKPVKCLIIVALALSGAITVWAKDNPSTLPYNLGDDTWRVFLNVKSMNPPAPYDVIPASFKANLPDAKPVKPITVKMKNNRIDLAALNGGFRRYACAYLYHEFESKRAGVMQVGVAADWQMDIWAGGRCVFTTMKKGNQCHTYTPNDHICQFPIKKGKNIIAVRVLSGSAGWLFVCGKPDKPKPNLVFKPNAEWKVANMDDLMIKAGSALDQSAYMEIPRGTGLLSFLGLGASEGLPRLTIAPDGRLAMEGRPGVPIRLKGTGVALGWALDRAFGWPGHPKIETPDWKAVFTREITSARRRGYNLFRIGRLNLGSDPAENRLDAVDFLLAEMGKNGVYGFLDCSCDKDIRRPWQAGKSRMDAIWRMFLGDELVRASWKRATAFILNHINPYTGLAWKDDPTIAFLMLNNEQETAFYHPKGRWSKETQVEIDVKFRQWLERKYRDPDVLAKAWKDKSITAFVDVIAPENFPSAGVTPMENDYLLFCAELAHKNAQWMRETIRGMGYKGLISMYNCSYWLGGQEARWTESQVCTANTYFNHPSAFDKPGSRCGQGSSIKDGATYWRRVAAYRNADRPFIETEYNHPFWNPYQHELANVFGAYSALQGFDGLSIHGGAAFDYVNDFRPGLNVFRVGNSPIARSCAFLSACLFLRGDVKRSPHRVELQIPKAYLDRDCNAGRNVSTKQDKIALITGFSVAFPWAKPASGVGVAPKPDMVIYPGKGGSIKWAASGFNAGAAEIVEAKDAKFSMADMVAKLKEKGVLSKDNLTDPDKGVYQSDTGELTMRTNENLVKIVTPRSEAVTMEGGKGENLGQFNVVKTSVPALVAACAVDNKPLAESERIVLVYVTDAVNSNMELSSNRVALIKLGEPPILIKVGALDASLKNVNAQNMSLYALGFDGTRREKLPLDVKDGQLAIHLDTGTLKDGPTTYFELVAE